tara:strand:- start:33 stop:209 length:177 start_codon:yes stop_codon:yes gene_type:complete
MYIPKAMKDILPVRFRRRLFGKDKLFRSMRLDPVTVRGETLQERWKRDRRNNAGDENE